MAMCAWWDMFLLVSIGIILESEPAHTSVCGVEGWKEREGEKLK